MRKRLITPISQDVLPLAEGWLELDRVAVVEVTWEEKENPVEFALVLGEMRGWWAAASGSQIIRLFFDKPQRLTRISLVKAVDRLRNRPCRRLPLLREQ